MKNIPISGSAGMTRVTSGIFRSEDNEYYVKVMSELYGREHEFSLGFVGGHDGITEAVSTARKYQDLVDAGLYPPETQFLVIRDELGVITIMAVMPRLLEINAPFLSEAMLHLKNTAAAVLRVAVGRLSSDVDRRENYGFDGRRIYYFDLNVLRFHEIPDHGNRYRYISLA